LRSEKETGAHEMVLLHPRRRSFFCLFSISCVQIRDRIAENTQSDGSREIRDQEKKRRLQSLRTCQDDKSS